MLLPVNRWSVACVEATSKLTSAAAARQGRAMRHDRNRRGALASAITRTFGLCIVVSGVLSCGESGRNDTTKAVLAAPAEPRVHADSTNASAPLAVGQKWIYSHDEDQMTGKATHFAFVLSENSVNFGFPYEGEQRGQLTIRQHPRHGSDVIFRIERGQLLCPSYDGCTILVRFDEGEPSSFSASPPSDNSTESIFIRNFSRFVERMRLSKRVRIAPQVYQEGGVVFTFDVSGFDINRFRGR